MTSRLPTPRSPLSDWQLLTKDFEAPPIYIKAGFYFMVAAALQRRVWIGDIDHMPVYPNIFVAFCMKASGGKGIVTGTVEKLLKHHKWVPRDAEGNVVRDAEAVANSKKERPLLFPLAPDSTNYAQFAQELANSTRTFLPKPPFPKGIGRIYMHNSIAFIIDEFAGMFKTDSMDLCTMLLTAWTCKDDYDKKTKFSGCDQIRNPCVSLLAGVQPKIFCDLVRKNIIENGLVARTFFLSAPEVQRQNVFIENPTEEQRQAKERLLTYLYWLSQQFGQLTLEPIAKEWLTEYYRSSECQVNKASCLAEYYGRKNLHMQKLSMLTHFAYPKDNDDGIITILDVQRGVEILAEWEQDMHKVFEFAGRNPVMTYAPDVISTLVQANGFGLELDDLYFAHANNIKRVELESLVDDLVRMKKIRSEIRATGTKYYANK
jgi:hypothetical protein